MLWQLILGHISVIGGCYLVTWGLNLLPRSTATPADILKKPLFWGMFAIMGGFCFFYGALF